MMPIGQVFRWIFGWQTTAAKSTSSNINFESSALIAKLAEGSHDDRVNFVRDLQSRQHEIKANYEASISKLEQDQYKQYEPILKHLYAIVNTSADGSPGIPNFWLSALKRHYEIAATINKRDEDALSHLVAVRVEFLNGKDFRLCFDFNPNNYFINKTLTKTYRYKPDASGILRPHSSMGEDIKWRPGTNLKQIILQGKPGREPEVMTVDSFFDFFYPAATPDVWLRDLDFKLGEKVKQDIIPHAVDYYTGVIGEDFADAEFGLEEESGIGYESYGDEEEELEAEDL